MITSGIFSLLQSLSHRLSEQLPDFLPRPESYRHRLLWPCACFLQPETHHPSPEYANIERHQFSWRSENHHPKYRRFLPKATLSPSWMPLKQALVGEVKTHCPTRFWSCLIISFLLIVKSKTESPGRPSGVSEGFSSFSIEDSQPQAITEVAKPVRALAE